MTPRLSKGFTLLEVLIALAVLAIGLGAIIQAAAGSASSVGELKTRTIAGWVAANQINRTLLTEGWPELGRSRGEAAMAGRRWRWTLEVSATADSRLRRLDMAVNHGGEEAAAYQVTAFARESAGISANPVGQ